MCWFSRPKFCISNTNGKKVQKNAQCPICGQKKAFRYEITFRGIQPNVFFMAESLARFQPKIGAWKWEFFLATAKCMVPGCGATNHVVPFENSLLAAHKGPIKAHWLVTLYGLRKMIYADVFWATKVQPLHSFFISKIDEHASELKRAREREPVALVIIKSPVVFIFIREIDDFQSENRSTTSKEKVEGLWTGYEGACYYFRKNYKRSQVTMLTSRKVFLACLSLGQEEEMGGLVGIVFSFRINPTRTTYKNSCLYHYI